MVAVLYFMSPIVPSVHNAVHLFWNMYQPRMMALSGTADELRSVPDFSMEDIEGTVHRQMYPAAPPPSPELDELFLKCLDWAYDKFRVPYEPDSDSAEWLSDLTVELHIAAARAFKLKQLEPNNMSEEWISRLRSVEHTVRRIKAIAEPYGSPYWSPSFAVSIDAIWGMTQLELSRICRVEGSYADAIDYLARSAYSILEAFEDLGNHRTAQALLGIEVFGEIGPEDMHGGSPWTSSLEWDEAPIKREELRAQQDLKSRLAPMEVSLKEAASLFDLLKQSVPIDANWRAITEDCHGLAVLPGMELDVFTGVNDLLEDEENNLVLEWSEFWHSAGAWASAQLSPNELAKFHQITRETEAETRLRNYFFGSSWPFLPKRAQRRLINADSLLNSTQRVALEALLNELQVATEEICHRVIWQPLKSVGRSQSFELLNEVAKLEEKQRSSDLGIADYEWICRRKWYREFLDMKSLDSNDIRFLTRQLPDDMRQLRSERNIAQHEIGASATPDSPQSFYRGFLGIGRPGILPELARIGRKLQGLSDNGISHNQRR